MSVTILKAATAICLLISFFSIRANGATEPHEVVGAMILGEILPPLDDAGDEAVRVGNDLNARFKKNYLDLKRSRMETEDGKVDAAVLDAIGKQEFLSVDQVTELLREGEDLDNAQMRDLLSALRQANFNGSAREAGAVEENYRKLVRDELAQIVRVQTGKGKLEEALTLSPELKSLLVATFGSDAKEDLNGELTAKDLKDFLERDEKTPTRLSEEKWRELLGHLAPETKLILGGRYASFTDKERAADAREAFEALGKPASPRGEKPTTSFDPSDTPFGSSRKESPETQESAPTQSRAAVGGQQQPQGPVRGGSGFEGRQEAPQSVPRGFSGNGSAKSFTVPRQSDEGDGTVTLVGAKPPTREQLQDLAAGAVEEMQNGKGEFSVPIFSGHNGSSTESKCQATAIGDAVERIIDGVVTCSLKLATAWHCVDNAPDYIDVGKLGKFSTVSRSELDTGAVKSLRNGFVVVQPPGVPAQGSDVALAHLEVKGKKCDDPSMPPRYAIAESAPKNGEAVMIDANGSLVAGGVKDSDGTYQEVRLAGGYVQKGDSGGGAFLGGKFFTGVLSALITGTGPRPGTGRIAEIESQERVLDWFRTNAAIDVQSLVPQSRDPQIVGTPTRPADGHI